MDAGFQEETLVRIIYTCLYTYKLILLYICAIILRYTCVRNFSYYSIRKYDSTFYIGIAMVVLPYFMGRHL